MVILLVRSNLLLSVFLLYLFHNNNNNNKNGENTRLHEVNGLNAKAPENKILLVIIVAVIVQQ